MTPDELRSARLALGLTQRALGALLDVSENTIWRWEAGAMPVEHPGMLRLALEQLAAEARLA